MHIIAISSTADVNPIGRHPPIAGRKCDNLVVTSILIGMKDLAITQDCWHAVHYAFSVAIGEVEVQIAVICIAKL